MKRKDLATARGDVAMDLMRSLKADTGKVL